ncbi:MAG: transcription-repair coupling factor [Deltaproteobacteria bacterium]|nr:transcription-repair coupling factor [Deltaproteobacteria bacterium]
MTPAARILERLLKGERRLLMPHITGALRAQIAAELIQKGKVPVLIAESQEDAEALYRDLAFMLGTTDELGAESGLLFFGADDKSPYEEYSPDGSAVMERIGTLYRLAREPKAVRALVVTPLALVRRHVPPSYFQKTGDYLVTGEELDRPRLLQRLADTGYNSVTVVEDPGTFSVRGGILDIYSPYRAQPIRVDLFGDTIESIRLFDPTTQRTASKIEDAIVLPAREVAYSPEVVKRATDALRHLAEEQTIPTRRINGLVEDIENRLHFFGIEMYLPLFHDEGLVSADVYLPKGEQVVYLYGSADVLHAAAADIETEVRLGYEHALAAHQLALPTASHVADSEEVLERATKSVVVVELPEVVIGDRPKLEVAWQSTGELRSEILKATRQKSEGDEVLHPLIHRLKTWRAEGYSTVIVCQTRGAAERLRDLLTPKNLQVRLLKEPFDLRDLTAANQGGPNRQANLRDRSVHAVLALGDISAGFVLPSAHLVLLSEEEIFGQRLKRRKKKRAPAAGEFVSDLKDLKPGDFVVHVDYGIGLYNGLTKIAVNGVESDFLYIEYKGQDKLYLPVHRLRLISKYASGSEDGKKPALDKLGSTTWATTKKKIKDTLLKMAAELLRLYAVRQSMEGHAFPAPGERFAQFEAEFAFEPTVDQVKAIQDCVNDMQKAAPMDRVICGDVGYGKTEVAMRATMHAFESGKQVAVLVPTTVLAAQHFHVFSERFANFGAKIGIVSRFQEKEEIDKTLKALKEGQIDIIIGTHRLLSKDVHFKDLGLLVIDEEHRFGVAHKERLKKYRAEVHVLCMSATPIPRTLHMGFMGVRDMSVIATPPEDRLAVKTEVHKFSEEIIRDAIVKELKRGGQCFVVHNRVDSIQAFAKMLERLVPEARIGIGHGQMDEERLERVMVEFMNHQTNVLLSTTIIESGIDIPNANTMLINRADRFGLAQLYQLRGRVGRAKNRGFAYFLIPAGNLTKKARARISVLQRFTELGAGFKVASSDLEIRGAGNLLGKQQHGTISAVGFDMYQALLQEAIAELKGSHRKSLKEPEINVPIPALIPDAYLPAAGERLSFYQRFNAADTDDGAYNLLQEITDLYGNPPAEVENLAQLMLVKQRLFRIGALGLDYGAQTKLMGPRIVVRFDAEQPGVTPEQLVKYVNADPRRRKLTPEGKLVVHLASFEDPRDILTQSRSQLDELLRLKHRS